MRRLRTASTRRLYGIVAVVALLAATAGIAQAALSGSPAAPAAKPLDRAVLDALRAPDVSGVSARVKFTNGLLPGGSLPDGAGSPLTQGAEGRLWAAGDGRFRVELQSDRGDAQIVDDGERVTLYDPGSKTAYTAPSQARKQTRDPAEQPTLAGVRRALDRLGQTWTLSGAKPGATGNRPSYTIRIAPKDDGGLLGAAELAWDAAKGVPLRAAVYAQGQDQPVLELEATDVSFGSIPGSTFSAQLPKGARVVELDPPSGGAPGEATHVQGVDAVSAKLDFPLAAPAELAGLPRTDVRLVRIGERTGAVSIYGKGMGAIAVLQHRVAADSGGGAGGLRLPQINIDGATGTELATPLGTVVTFTRGDVSFTVAGLVPPVAAENAARGLR
jgi:outer membrane lipoprotein-sorting protein